MSIDSQMDAQMSPKEVAETQKFQASQFRTTWAKARLISREESEEICDHCVTFHALAALRNGGIGPQSFGCDYPDGKFSAELSCGKCISQKKLCGSQAIQAAHEKYAEKEKERRKKKRNALKAERQQIRKEQEAKRAARKRQNRENQIELLRAAAHKRLKRDRQLAGLHLELTILYNALMECVPTKSEDRREPECRRKRRQEEHQELKMLATMMNELTELTSLYKENFGSCRAL